MTHLIVCREYPPFPYPPGGIGTYVDHLSRLLVDRGDTVHVVAQLWPGAARTRDVRMAGRLTIHRVPLDEPLAVTQGGRDGEDRIVLRELRRSAVPVLAFAWQVARLVELLADREGIDVVEAQEYEAPLYYLLQRRSDGLPAIGRVPILVHLHTPSEFLYEQNQWDRTGVDYELLRRVEEYTIRAADALVCPSRFLARIAERHYGLGAQSIDVIPYPVGDVPVLPRTARVWETGDVCYIGRLEARKGVHEWIEAAVSVGAREPSIRFTFVGGDPVHWGTGGVSVRQALRARIPPSMHERVTFVDAVPRPRLARYRQQARIAVVPSRWENFPNTCIEAMASGLPVLVSPTGGMAEVVEDGRTGWVAEGQDASSLAAALGRAVSTPPDQLARMGEAAAASVRALCDNAETVRRHRELRARIADLGARRGPQARGASVERPRLETLTGEIRVATDAARRAGRAQSAHTMTPVDVLRAAPRQQLAVVRRALSNPRYVMQWVLWHGRRALTRVSRAGLAAAWIRLRTLVGSAFRRTWAG